MEFMSTGKETVYSMFEDQIGSTSTPMSSHLRPQKMDIDSPDDTMESPRSGQKKKSALSRLAEHRLKKRNSDSITSPLASETEKIEPPAIQIDPPIAPIRAPIPAKRESITDKRIVLKQSDSVDIEEDNFGSSTSLSGRKKKNSALERLKARKSKSQTSMGSVSSLDEQKSLGSKENLKEVAISVPEKLKNVVEKNEEEFKPMSILENNLNRNDGAKIETALPELQNIHKGIFNKDSIKDIKLPENLPVAGISQDSRRPSDNTISRFRSLKMGSTSDSPDSPQFQPTPPGSPKQGRVRPTPQIIPRGEKRIRDNLSSGEELDKESGRPRHRKQSTIEKQLVKSEDDEGMESVDESDDDDIIMGKTHEIVYNSNITKDVTNESVLTSDELDTTQGAIQDQYRKLLTDKESDHNQPKYYAVNNMHIPERKKGLEPMKTVHPTPPLEKDFKSTVLKTAYKKDSLGSTGSSTLGNSTLESPRKLGALDSLSERSTVSFSSMPPIATLKAKNRNFLVGSGSGLLGQEELDRHFPDKKLRLFVGTWNMEEKKFLPDCINDFLLPESSEYVHDMYVIGTQEQFVDRKEWQIQLQETLGPSHVLFHAVQHGSLGLCVFIRRDLIWFLSVPESDIITTSPTFQVIKTKGCAALSFNVFGTSFLFMDSHFSAHQTNSEKRIADYEKTKTTLNLPKSVKVNEHVNTIHVDVTARFDVVFWMGDLNFRVQRSKQHVHDMLDTIAEEDNKTYDNLLADDELLHLINEGKVFHHFQEGRILFAPTYKFDSGSDSYDSSKKQRIPSYTDRVLFRSKRKNGVQCTEYNCASSIRYSDHRPVFGFYEVFLRPGRENIPLAAGLFNRDVYLEANRRRALSRDVIRKMKAGQASSSVCVIQ